MIISLFYCSYSSVWLFGICYQFMLNVNVNILETFWGRKDSYCVLFQKEKKLVEINVFVPPPPDRLFGDHKLDF